MRFQFGGFQLDDERFTLTGPDGPVHVEPQVFELLHHLVAHHERLVTKQELYDAVWGHTFVSESALTSRLKSARRAVGDDGTAQRVIKTVHGRGYQFVAPVELVGPDREADAPRRAIPRLRNRPIGRDDDIDEVTARVAAAPLLTITGPGGIGKTTVALAVAARVEDDYDDGVVVADLAAVPAGSDVTLAVAQASGVESDASGSPEALGALLAGRPMLLVLDNCEHVVPSVADLVDRIVGHGGQIDVLATSREPLHVAGEHLWPLGPLHADGPALFVERARAAEPRLDWDPADPAVVELCRRLDDVPLAIELAAGQLRRFELAELSERLDERIGLGSASPSGARHASMETAIDWSYQLLGPDEQRLLRHLSVFPSTFDLRSVEDTAPPVPRIDAVAVFGQLLDKSLVVRVPGSGRYRLLETIRSFAGERLDDADERDDAVEWHRAHIAARARGATRLDRWMSARLAASLRPDLDDARQAFGRSLAAGEVADAVEIAIAASFLWRNATGWAEGDTWIDALLETDLAPGDRVWVHILRADVGQGRGDHRQMFGAAEAALACDDGRDAAASCLAAHYRALADLTDPDRARTSLETAAELARRSGDQRLITLMRTFQAVAVLTAGDPRAAARAVDGLCDDASEDGYDLYILHWAGWMTALAQQDAAAVWSWMRRQQDLLDRTGIVETWLTRLSRSMCLAVEGSDLTGELGRALTLARREGYGAEPDCLLVLSYAEICAGRLVSAAELIATAMHARFNATAHHVLHRAVVDPALRAGLDDATRAEATRRGRSRTASEVLAAHGVAV